LSTRIHHKLCRLHTAALRHVRQVDDIDANPPGARSPSFDVGKDHRHGKHIYTVQPTSDAILVWDARGRPQSPPEVIAKMD
jgi:hypothetical protein